MQRLLKERLKGSLANFRELAQVEHEVNSDGMRGLRPLFGNLSELKLSRERNYMPLPLRCDIRKKGNPPMKCKSAAGFCRNSSKPVVQMQKCSSFPVKSYFFII